MELFSNEETELLKKVFALSGDLGHELRKLLSERNEQLANANHIVTVREKMLDTVREATRDVGWKACCELEKSDLDVARYLAEQFAKITEGPAWDW